MKIQTVLLIYLIRIQKRKKLLLSQPIWDTERSGFFFAKFFWKMPEPFCQPADIEKESSTAIFACFLQK